MTEPTNVPAMSSVRSDDVILDRWALSSKRMLGNLAVLVLVWAAVWLAEGLLHVPFLIVGFVLTAVVAGVELVRWRRTRR